MSKRRNGGTAPERGSRSLQSEISRRSGVPGYPCAPAPRGPGRCCHRGRSPLRTTDRKLPGPGPRPGNADVEGRASDQPTDWKTPPWHHPQRTSGRKPGSGALIEPTIGLRNASQAEYQVPVALSKPSTKFPDQQPGQAASSRGEESSILSSRGQN